MLGYALNCGKKPKQTKYSEYSFKTAVAAVPKNSCFPVNSI